MAVLSVLAAAALVAQKPNIVFILSDDQGFSDTSDSRTTMNHPGPNDTPFLEKMAEEGVAFTNMYTNGANCAPTRAALLTGQYASRSTNNVFNVNNLNRGSNGKPLRGHPNNGYKGDDVIPPTSITMAETLQTAGYETAYVGKFHVSENGVAVTRDHGFDINYGGDNHGHPNRYHARNGKFGSSSYNGQLDVFGEDYTQEYVNANIRPYAEDKTDLDSLVGTAKHLTDAVTDAAIEFLANANSGKPKFLFLGHYAVHTPLGKGNVRLDLARKYERRGNPKKYFGALLEGLDQSIARIVGFLENTNDPRRSGHTLAENTLVVFMSDNGGRLPNSDNGPFSGQKGLYKEGGIRVPFIAWSRNTDLVKAGHINNVPAIGTDLYTTFAEIAGAELPADYPLDGRSIAGLFRGSNAAETALGERDLFWHFPGYLAEGSRVQTPESIIRSGDMKLTYTYQNKKYRLYNLQNDPKESRNLLASSRINDFRRRIAARMSRRLVQWLQDVEAPYAIVRSSGKRTGPPKPLPEP